MNLLKSFFIFIAPAWLIYISIIAAINLIKNHYFLANCGVLLSALPLLLFLGYILAFKKLARTSEHLLLVLIPSITGYVVVLVFFLQNTNISIVFSMFYSLSAFFITFLYTYWYSNNKRLTSEKLTNNSQLPEFKVFDTKGLKISSNSFIGKKTIIFFYRGNWCPLCMAQIQEVADNFKKLADNNIETIFISPQSEQNSQSLADKFKLSFQFYRDIDNQAANQLGILHKFGLPLGFQALGYDTHSVYPTIIAINEKGTIVYNDQTDNYRIRPEPQELLKIFI